MSLYKILALSLVVAVSACGRTNEGGGPQGFADVDGARIVRAEAEEWLSHGRDYGEQRFSPLTSINQRNVSRLGLAWYADLPTRRGIETTPLMADGVLYVTASWGHVLAYDARTGGKLWHFDPKVPKDYAVRGCCDGVNRGVALWQDKVLAASYDGKLRAIDRKTGDPLWEVDTRINTDDPYTITGAPRVVNGKVIIGNGGAELGVRGYVSAYDATNGKLVWRFFTVPGDPAKGFEDDTQEWIASTWNGEWWKNGKGGGTAWDSFAFDPSLNLLYIGVGNGSSWNHKVRSNGEGDNLFVSSIVAVNADTGKYVWHYQTTPADSFDYTATQHMILADLVVKGKKRKVIMQAPKNGFFYVLDRRNGKLLSAEKYMPVNWASHVDMETGRPVEAEGLREGKIPLVTPGPSGAHNWQPMSYSPQTELVYIPALMSGAIYIDDFSAQDRKGVWNTNYAVAPMVAVPDELTNEQRAGMGEMVLKAVLQARDPKTNAVVWQKEGGFFSGGGLLSTAGNLLFQGDLEGTFRARAADTGEELWSQDVQGGIMGSPISYQLDDEQYIAVAQGWGGISGLPYGAVAGPRNMINISRLLVYKLDGDTALPRVAVKEQTLPEPTLASADTETIEAGRVLYNQYCAVCHGGNAISAGLISDLRYRINDIAPAWQAIVRDGAMASLGMPARGEFITEAEAEAIKHYVVHEAQLGHQRGEKRLVRE
ncbi:PQQ-dependent dehydrogenase, methanol/ethanol family [Spongiibacter sp. KMU-166]|uniref:PQQ-dependent dehydrogenase, methanol/ethanol family n=1 Tax=Spongiibacter thalassae TaxID=2721624 RepID=A0ABX1GL48_9GAMM|nr:PQQ-dependent dehydrogenase, methanol/ethanol family [Spongiibacter thalassae]NKI19128.1 PQQ-dependent dehydrogenase, methanol/ethanol family [Spongiibacter thalassae]